ncbi:MAG TPA: hypothetical protein VGX96_14665 [Candidatus Elarobacter sp.]|jgi:hypothetical protein|nr:hypothetical protein [Candidatus Elarobacter sp.]
MANFYDGALARFGALRQKSLKKRRAAPFTLVAIAVVLVGVVMAGVVWGRSEPALARTLPFWALLFSAVAGAMIFEFANPLPEPGGDERLSPAGNVELKPLIKMSERVLTRRRADYADVGNNLATLLGFVATGAGIVAATTGGKVALPTPLVIYAGAALLAVVLLCLLGLRPQHRDEGPATNIVEAFGGWLRDADARNGKTIDHDYVQYVLQSCDRYERARRIRRAYYVYAGWCLALALLTIGVNAVFPDCALVHAGAPGACAAAPK